jgi:hypothetical protein
VFADLGQTDALCDTQANSAVDLIAGDPVVLDQTLSSKHQHLMKRACDVRQSSLPVRRLFHPTISFAGVIRVALS